MSEVQLSFIPKFEQSERIKVLEARNQELGTNGMRQYGTYGDHRCWLNIGPFPKLDQLPSKVQGYRMSSEQWGEDYRFMIENNEPHIYPCETIVGEIYWEIGLLRPCGSGGWRQAPNAEEIGELVRAANELGGYPTAYGHTCPDPEIILKEGFDHILGRIRKNLRMYEDLKEERTYVWALSIISRTTPTWPRSWRRRRRIRRKRRGSARSPVAVAKWRTRLRRPSTRRCRPCTSPSSSTGPQATATATAAWIST